MRRRGAFREAEPAETAAESPGEGAARRTRSPEAEHAGPDAREGQVRLGRVPGGVAAVAVPRLPVVVLS